MKQTLPLRHRKLLKFLKSYCDKNYTNLERFAVDTPRKKKHQFSIRDVAQVLNTTLPKNMELVITIKLKDNSLIKKKNFLKGIEKHKFKTLCVGDLSRDKNWIVIY